MGISTRPAVASDEEFVNALTREAMRPYVEATWPSDEEREEYYWLNRFQQNETEIIQVDGEDAGRITITRRPGCIVLDSSFHEKLYNRGSGHTTPVAPAVPLRHRAFLATAPAAGAPL